VRDYRGGKQDWINADLPVQGEGEAAPEIQAAAGRAA
jgi:hypothetical protein